MCVFTHFYREVAENSFTASLAFRLASSIKIVYADMMSFSKKRLLAYILLALGTAIWGAAFIVVKPALDVISPVNFLFSRFLLASILSLPLLIYYGKKIKITGKILLTIFLLELIGTTFNLGVLYLGLAQTSAIEANLISTTSPLFIILLGIFLLHEKQEKHEWLGTILSFVGMIIITLSPAFNQAISENSSLWGNFLIIVATITEAFYFIGVKKYYKKIPTLFVAPLSFWVGAISFGLITLWQNQWSVSSLQTELAHDFTFPSVWLAVGYMAIFGSIVALAFHLKGLKNIEASEASIFRYLQPLIYLPLGAFFLGETMNALQYVGLAMVVGGFVIAEFTHRRS